jgi:hypothetical protein
MKLTITHNFPDVAKQINSLRDDVAKQATARALNRTVEQAKTSMSREIRAEFVLPAAKVNQALRINRARASAGTFNLEASLESPAKRGRSLNLANFGARQTKKGVSFKIKRNGQRVVIPGSFLINAGKTVMIRTGKARLPIKALQTIDVAQMFNTKRINSKVVQVIKDRFPAIFEREAKFYVDKFNAQRTV